MFTKELKFIESVLPDRYKCEIREKGVHCFDTTGKGINDDHKESDRYDPETDNQWGLIVKALKQKFGNRLMEIFSQEAQYHSKFTVYLKAIDK